jgi:hypothetical protein
MDAVHAHLNFKLSALILVLSTAFKNVPNHEVIPIEICFKISKGKLHFTKQVG